MAMLTAPVRGRRSMPLLAAAAGLVVGALVGAAFAQDARQPPELPPQHNPQTTVPEKIDPPLEKRGADESTGSLSNTLERSKGVIRPPGNVDPEIRVPAPVPDPGTTRVIPPPGSPGNAAPVEPR